VIKWLKAVILINTFFAISDVFCKQWQFETITDYSINNNNYNINNYNKIDKTKAMLYLLEMFIFESWSQTCMLYDTTLNVMINDIKLYQLIRLESELFNQFNWQRSLVTFFTFFDYLRYLQLVCRLFTS
jgi:hypothetical protein